MTFTAALRMETIFEMASNQAAMADLFTEI